MALPAPADLTSLLVRTDYSDELAWGALAAASAPVPTRYGTFAVVFTVADDPSLDGSRVHDLVTMSCDGYLNHLFVADALTMRDHQRTLLVLDRDTKYANPAAPSGSHRPRRGRYRTTCAWRTWTSTSSPTPPTRPTACSPASTRDSPETTTPGTGTRHTPGATTMTMRIAVGDVAAAPDGPAATVHRGGRRRIILACWLTLVAKSGVGGVGPYGPVVR